MGVDLQAQQRAVSKMVLRLFLFSLSMFGFGYALVPLYNVMCQQLGLNGKTLGQQKAYVGAIDTTRTITVEFIATNNSQLPWSFFPATHEIKLHPGEMKRIAFFARNNTDQAMTVQAIPSVSPGLVARYLKKTECFCFIQQTLNAGEGRDMPLIFHLDPEIPSYIERLTLSYTLFDITGKKIKLNQSQGRLA